MSHPGNYMDDREAGIARNADAITEALAASLGRRFSVSRRQLVQARRSVHDVRGTGGDHLARRAISRSTRHLRRHVYVYSAGHDLVKDYDGVFTRSSDAMGLGG